MSKRKQHSPDFKAKVALEALKGLTLPPDPGRSGVESVPVSFS